MKAHEGYSALQYIVVQYAQYVHGRKFSGHIQPQQHVGIYLRDTSATQGYCFVTHSLD